MRTTRYLLLAAAAVAALAGCDTIDPGNQQAKGRIKMMHAELAVKYAKMCDDAAAPDSDLKRAPDSWLRGFVEADKVLDTDRPACPKRDAILALAAKRGLYAPPAAAKPPA